MVERNARYFRCRYDTHHPPKFGGWYGKTRTRTRQGHAQFWSWRNGKTIWNCHTFVVPLYCWWNGKNERHGHEQGKARQEKAVSLRHHDTASSLTRQVSSQLGDARLTIWNCHTFVIPLYCWNKNQIKSKWITKKAVSLRHYPKRSSCSWWHLTNAPESVPYVCTRRCCKPSPTIIWCKAVSLRHRTRQGMKLRRLHRAYVTLMA